MTDKKISELTEVTSPSGTDVLPIVSGGETKKVTVTNLRTLPSGFNVGEAVPFWGPGWVIYPTANEGFALFAGARDFMGPYFYVLLDPTLGNTALSLYADDGAGHNTTLTLTAAGLAVTSSGVTVISASDLPSADPGVAGQVYSDGVPSAGVPKVLKISGG